MTRAKERILVTGGSGFIGTNLIGRLRAEKHCILNVDSVPPRNPTQIDLYRQADILDRDRLCEIFCSFTPTQVYHLAARTGVFRKSLDEFHANIRGVENLITVSNATPSIRRIIFASTRLVCHIHHQATHDEDYAPTTFYGQSKMIGERLVRRAAINAEWMIVRPTSIWGPWFAAPYRHFFDHVRRGLYFHPDRLHIFKSYGYVGNTVHQMIALMNAPVTDVGGKTLYLADYPPTDLAEWAALIREAYNAPRIRRAPLWLLTAIAKVGDLMLRAGISSGPLTSFRLNNLCTTMIYDTAELERIGRVATPFAKGRCGGDSCLDARARVLSSIPDGVPAGRATSWFADLICG